MAAFAIPLGACAGGGSQSASVAATLPATATPAPSPPDPQTSVALVAIAQRFNDDYAQNNDGPVYDRWDARSQALISRTDYLRRHAECANGPQSPAHVLSVVPNPSGAWLVRYEIDGSPFTDYWFYVRDRWVFDIVLSNPESARLYRLSFPDYASAIGCTHR
jgi:hypothetical protein